MCEASASLFQLSFPPLSRTGRAYAFPCDIRGLVDLDRLSDTARNNYLYARAMIGRELSVPAVEATGCIQQWLLARA